MVKSAGACHTWHWLPMRQLLVSLASLSTPCCLRTVQVLGLKLHAAGLCTRRALGGSELHMI